MNSLKILLIIGSGGFIGTIARYLLSRWVMEVSGPAFPMGTFVVNLLGSFLIGIFYGLSERGGLLSAEWRLFLTVGLCGGFTTFSTFANENLLLLRDNELFYFALYAGLSLFLGLVAVYAGSTVTKLI
ncbi:MAG: fluoride efflux transporter CrcB [Bacteroidales bacterium]